MEMSLSTSLNGEIAPDERDEALVASHRHLASNWKDPWAVIQAGGDGARLQSLTLKIAGDGRPKQFCHIFDEKSLLTQTRELIEPLFRSARTLFVVRRVHERHYCDDLHDVDRSCILAQPRNRGTGLAVAAALLCILQREADPLVEFFPFDHYYSNDAAFVSSVRSAIASASRNPESVVLLGSQARYPEVEYGWIEPRPAISAGLCVPTLRVDRFWEKPSFSEARTLLNRGCLWNTFVMVGKVNAFLELISTQTPQVLPLLASGPCRDDLTAAYDRLSPMDLSRQVLAPQPQRLLVACDSSSGWSDLGSPTRVFDTLARNRIKPAWLVGH